MAFFAVVWVVVRYMVGVVNWWVLKKKLPPVLGRPVYLLGLLARR